MKHRLTDGDVTHLLTDGDARTYLDMGITANDVVRLKYPDATDEEASHLLWEHTPFPLVSGIHNLADLLPTLQCNCPSDVELANG